MSLYIADNTGGSADPEPEAEKSVAKADFSQIPASRVQKLLETPEAQAEAFERYGIKVVVTLIQLEGRIAKAVLVENTERVEDDSCTFGPQGQINPPSYRTESLGTYRLLAFGPTQINSKVLAELKVFDAIEQQKAIGKAHLLEAALHVIPFGTAADAVAGGNVSGTELLLATIGDAAWLGAMAAKLTWKSGQAVFATQKAVRIARGATILNRGADIGQIGVAAKEAVEEPTAWKIVVAAGIATLTLFGLAWKRIANKSAKYRIAQVDEVIDIGRGDPLQHFTDLKGASGITGIPENVLKELPQGQRVVVDTAHLKPGTNPFLTGEAGGVGVTKLGSDATPAQLNGIGVFGEKQQFVLEFSQETVINSGVRLRADLPERSIWSLPGDTILKGTVTIKKAR